MLTSKQRAQLRKFANQTETIFQIGKGGIGEQLTKQIADALRSRELIKLHVLDTCEFSPKEAAKVLAERTESEVVFVIGRRFVLYKSNPEKPIIHLHE